MKKNIKIKTEYIKLNQLLKWCGETSTGGEADMLIADGKVSFNGEIEFRRGKKVRPGDIVNVNNNEYTVKGDIE